MPSAVDMADDLEDMMDVLGDQVDPVEVEALQKLNSYVGGGWDAITAGWRAKVIARKPKEEGKDNGGPRRDVYYISPSGERFRSRSEVLRHLNGEPKRPRDQMSCFLSQGRASSSTASRSSEGVG